MTVFVRRSFVIPLLLLICTSVVLAAISLSISNTYTQNFDGIGTAATAPLPADFRVDALSTVRTVGTFSAALTATARMGGASLSTSAGNGIYNFGSGTTTTGADRAVGFLSSSGGTASGNLYAQLVNTTGGSLSGLQVSYGVEKYRNGTNAAGFRIQMFYSADGNTWTNAGSSFLTSFPADANNNGFATAPGAIVPVSSQTLSATIANGNSFYLAWNYSVASTSTTTNAQALAIDDISILGIPGGTPTNPTGLGAASPGTVQAGNSTLLTIAVTPGANPASTGLAVTANLSAIGGSATQQFFDDGTHGDAVPGDNTFSFQAAVPAATSAGGKTIPSTIADAQARSGSTPISLTVTPASTPPSGVGSASPGILQAGSGTLLTVNVTPGSNPIGAIVSVLGDLSSIGGSASQQFYDDATYGDVTANDQVFSFQATVASDTTAGAKSLPIVITDDQARSGATTISLTVQPPPPPTTVKISQVYGGGGNSGSTYTNDFIEIYNQASTPVDLTGWSVQYSSAGATSWVATGLCPSGTCILGPGHYFLVKESQGTGGTTDLPPADATGTLALSGTNGKVALVADTVLLSGACPAGGSLVDLVGYGSANCSENAPTPSLSNTTAAVRRGNGCTDTDNNAGDFVTIGPIPRNGAAPPHSCGGDPSQPSGLGIASPSSLDPASNTLLTVRVTGATTPPSTAVAVTADLMSIGGASSQPFYDDGTHGDQAAGDDVFSFQATIGAFIQTGAKNIVATLTDAEGRRATPPITLTVTSPTCGVERWSVKTGTDPDAGMVNLDHAIATTIADLGTIPAPPDPPGPPLNRRLTPTETNVYVVNATLTLYKKESDVDYHIVLKDETGHTLIAEIPSPACVGVSSPFGPGVAGARSKFDARLTATSFFQTADIPVRVKGVGFFDFEHGQTGIAPNGIELHPVIDIDFTANTSTTLTSSANPSQFGEPVAIAATVTNGGTGAPSGNVTFLEGGIALGSSALDQNGRATFGTTSLPAGSHSVTASYEGDGTSAPSTSAALVQVVDKADQTIDFGPLAEKTYGDVDFTVSAEASSSLAAGFSIVSGPATMSGDTVHITGAGAVTVRASQAGDANFNAAPDVDRSFDVAKANQTIAFAVLPDKTYGDPPFTVNGSGGGSGNPVTFSAGGHCTSSGLNGRTIAITSAGACTITASQAGNSSYDAALDVSRNLTVNQAAGSIIVNGYSDVYDGHPHGAGGSATGVNGEDLSDLLNLGATFADVPGGTAHWTFAGNTNYAPASGDATIAITKATAAITVTGYTGVYDGHAHGASGSATGVNSEDLAGLLNLGSSFTDVPGGTASWTFAGNTNYGSASGSAGIVITRTAAAFSNLSAPVITDHTASATLSGKISLGSLIPTGNVAITLNGATQNAPIQADGAFSSNFSTTSLTPLHSPYAITYSFGGDGNFTSTSGTATVTVRDTTPPVIQATAASPATIWPPNKDMVPVTVTASTVDAVDSAPACVVAAVAGNDGATPADWEIIGPASVNLRADRTGHGSGRRYQITVRCTDASGNAATSVAIVTVPHDQRE
jgi:hypothetical protein